MGHAPCPPEAKGCPVFTDYAIEVYKQIIRFCESIGLRYLVIHGIKKTIDDDTHAEEKVRRMNMHLYSQLIPILKETNVVVCLENLFYVFQGNMTESTCSDADEALACVWTQGI